MHAAGVSRCPRGRRLRPTAARVKEALFNILPHDLSGSKALDLFAGTGNVTIEALSRGAAAAILVDSSVESGKAIEKTFADFILPTGPRYGSCRSLGRYGS